MSDPLDRLPSTVPSQADLHARCAQEPIHTPGAIQSFGALLSGRLGDFTIRHASSNLADFLELHPRNALKSNLFTVLPSLTPADFEPERVEATHTFQAPAFLRAVTATCRTHAGHWFVQLERGGHRDTDHLPVTLSTGEVLRLTRHESLPALADDAVKLFRRLLGYRRVMIYRFHEDWHGEVIAESTSDPQPAFLGLHYPASDIPPQARELYVTERLRLIPDTEAPVAPLLTAPSPEPAAPLDLSGCALRALSPVHLTYLRNMEVRASLVTSLVVKGRLWGLIACHHDSPRWTPPATRSIAVALTEVLSGQIGSLLAHEQNTRVALLRRTLLDLGHRLDGGSDAWQLFTECAPDLLTPLQAEGVALLSALDTRVHGQTPPPSACRELFTWLEQTRPASGLVALNTLPPHLAAVPCWPPHLAGLLAAHLGPTETSKWLIFFRTEWPHEVRWAGDPRHTVSLNPDETLCPRHSFSIWTEIQRGRARPWSEPEIDYAHELSVTLRNSLIIQERLRAEVALRLGEDRAAIIAAIPDNLFVLDAEGRYLSAHEPAEDRTAPTAATFVGRTLHEVLPPEVAATLDRARAELAAGRKIATCTYGLDVPGLGLRHFEARLVPCAPGETLMLVRDITLRITAQRALEEERSILRTIFENALAGYWDLDFVRGTAFYSEAYKAMLGYGENDFGDQPDSWKRHAFPEDLAVSQASFQRHIDSRGKIPFSNRMRFHHRDGSVRHVLCSGSVIAWSPSGEPLRAVGSHIDFTSLYQAQEDNARLSLAAQHTSSAVVFTDPHHRIIWTNTAYTRITGYTAEESRGRTPSFLQGPGSDPATIAAIHAALAAGLPFHGEIVNHSKSGAVYWIDLEIIPHFNALGEPLGFIGVQADITLRKRYEAQLQTSLAEAERARDLLEAAGRIANLGHWEFFLDGRPLAWSAVTYAIHDLPVGQPVTIEDAVRFYAPAHRERIAATVRHGIETGEPFEGEAELVTATGRRVWVYSRGVAVRDEAQRVTSIRGVIQDITHRRETERALRDNEERLRVVIESTPNAVFLKDGEGRNLYINQVGLKAPHFAGLPWQGRTDAELALSRPEFADIFKNCIASDQAAWQARQLRTVEETLPGPAGAPTILEVTKVPLFNDDGSRRALVGIATDITRRKNDTALLERERNLFAGGPVAVLITSPTPGWPISYVSTNIAALLGYSAAQLSQQQTRYASLVHPADLAKVEADTHARLAARTPFFESSYRLLHADGSYRWFYEFTKPEYSDAGVCTSVRSYLFDQTKLKQAETDLRLREEQISAISQHIPGALYEFKRLPSGGCFPYASEGMRDLFGLDPDALRDDGAPFFRIVHADDINVLDCSIADSVKQCKDWAYEFRIQHPERGLRWIHGSSSPRRLADGTYVWDGYLFDITERKNAEEKLLREGKREAIERLAGGVAHDFNNYLASMTMSAEFLQTLPDASPRVRELANTLLTEIDAATGVARQLLAFTRDQPLQNRRLSVEPFLRECAAFALRGSSMRALVDVADRGLELDTDADLLRQVIFNLILNSRQAMKEKGSILLLAEGSPDGAISIRIADTGPGIPVTARASIFEPYFTTKHNGSGLGLFVVRSLVRRLGGDIHLDTTPSEGATFHIHLPPPATPPAPAPVPTPAPPPSTPAIRLFGAPAPADTHVLLLEDEPGQINLLKSFFDTISITSDAFSGGDALLAAAPAHRARGTSLVCLLDITVRGGLGGLDIAAALRTTLPEARIFLVSGYSAQWQQKEQSLAGLDIGFIAKPYHLRDLKACLLKR